VEALVRWRHPVRGWTGPDDYIGLAKDTGLIVPIGTGYCAEPADKPPAGTPVG
jgi:EAL domain-containing protein (putative c-di-GMP-specific phosphodiesterase class I)